MLTKGLVVRSCSCASSKFRRNLSLRPRADRAPAEVEVALRRRKTPTAREPICPPRRTRPGDRGAHHEFSGLADLHLHPVIAPPARAVGAVGALTDDAFEHVGSVPTGTDKTGIVQGVGRALPTRVLGEDLGQEPAPVEVGEGRGVHAVEPQQVKGHEDHWVGLQQRRCWPVHVDSDAAAGQRTGRRR